MLIPQGHAGRPTHSVADRTKPARLRGADLYVARMGWKPISSSNKSGDCCATSDVPYKIPLNDPKPLSGSLHDEILISPPPTPSSSSIPSPKAEKQPSVVSSRPCYRCVSYMHSVGIKRVFWTTDTGGWECAKIRDLVDGLDNLGAVDMSHAATALENLFVTKHEVLMLRRTMGNS
jgi:hypothetical protein